MCCGQISCIARFHIFDVFTLSYIREFKASRILVVYIYTFVSMSEINCILNEIVYIHNFL